MGNARGEQREVAEGHPLRRAHLGRPAGRRGGRGARRTWDGEENAPARGVGITRAALEDTVAYTAERRQHDRAIGDFQGVRWTAGEMATRVDTARLLTLRAADLADRGHDVTREIAMAKVHATQAAVDNANDALQLHGGIGYTTERHVERYLRDARLLTIAGGPNEGHRDTLGRPCTTDTAERSRLSWGLVYIATATSSSSSPRSRATTVVPHLWSS